MQILASRDEWSDADQVSTPKQIAANRLNATKSTGPKSDGGKAVSATNAMKHGALSKNAVLPWEDPSTLEMLRADLICDLAPVGTLEEILVGRITSLIWRLQRAGHFETAIFTLQKYQQDLTKAKENADAWTRIIQHFEKAQGTARLMGDKEISIYPREVEAWEVIAEKNELLNTDLAKAGRDFVASASAVSNLHRYEIGLERSLYKALHELQRLQAARCGSPVATPIAIDLHGDGE